jgi:integrative and conjugative element protein (TIGR02256 family)
MTTIIATQPESVQRVCVQAGVLAHMSRYRQHRWYAREAGGQLFGHFNDQGIEVAKATGPYRGDQRSRYAYRSSPEKAQRTIEAMSREGLLYLGEWHTHPEACPRASAEDRDTFARIVRRSTLRVSSLLLVIQGTADGPEGLAIYSNGSEGFHRWHITSPQLSPTEAS